VADETATPTKYTVLNLHEVDNQGTNFGIDENDYVFRMARVPLGCENSGVSYSRMRAGYRQPFGHKHKRQEEIYIVVSGGGRIKLDDDVVELQPWSAVRIAPDTMRCLEAGPEGVEYIAIGAPNTGPGDGDTVPGWWAD
jgi:mannose-6-phosphate isomerase-like protein (cupin superfamily)